MSFRNVGTYLRGAQTPGARSLRGLNFVQRRLMFLGRRYKTCFFFSQLSPRILRRLLDYWKNLYTADMSTKLQGVALSKAKTIDSFLDFSC